MNHHPTIEKMKQMRMAAMSAIYHDLIIKTNYHDLSTEEFVTTAIDAEWEARQAKKIKGLIQRSGMKITASSKDVDYNFDRKLTKAAFQRLLNLTFISQKENLIIIGPTGIGKSYLAQVIAAQACQMLIKAKYFITARFFEYAKDAKIQGTYLKFIKSIQKIPLLVLDDFGLHPFENGDQQLLLDLIEERHQIGSLIISSQIPVSKWHGLINEATVADAILDRLVNSSHRLNLDGKSLRAKHKPN